eukprot:4111581-Alexandrium_andersonii.AAC.1
MSASLVGSEMCIRDSPSGKRRSCRPCGTSAASRRPGSKGAATGPTAARRRPQPAGSPPGRARPTG